MPALPGLPLNVPSQISLPRDLPALANGVVPGAAAAPAAPAPAPAPSLLSALPDQPVRRLIQHRRPEDIMASTYSKGLAAVVTATAAAFGLSPSAAADPAAAQPTPQPNSTQQLPGLPALSQLSPIIQQAAGNPEQATQLLMAAAQAFTSHNPTAPSESKNVAASVNQFVQPGSAVPGAPTPDAAIAPPSGPAPHVPASGIEPGLQSHLPAGIDPAHAGGACGRVGTGAQRAPGSGAVARCAVPCPCASPGFRPRFADNAGLHVPLDRDKLSGGRQ